MLSATHTYLLYIQNLAARNWSIGPIVENEPIKRKFGYFLPNLLSGKLCIYQSLNVRKLMIYYIE